MKKFVLVMAAAVATLSVSENLDAMEQVCFKTFTTEQQVVMQDAYDYGKPRGYGWTMAAMAWQETSAGDQMINWSDPSFGIVQINIKTATKRYKLTTWKEQLAFVNRLVSDNEFTINAASDELDFWKGVHKGNMRKMWASYNGGYNYKAKAPQHYSDGIAKKINFLKTNRCLFF